MESTSDPYQLSDLVEEVASICKTTFTDLVDTLHLMYDMSDNKIPHVKGKIIEHFKQFCKDMLEQQLVRKNEMVAQLESLDKDRFTLMKQLEIEIRINPVLKSLPLQTQIDQRKTILKDYEDLWMSRMATFKQLIEQEAAICNFIGEERFPISHDELPSEIDAHSFNVHLEKVKLIKDNRMQLLNRIKQRTLDKLQQLESEPDSPILEELLNKEPRNLTEGYLHLLEDEETRLDRKLASSRHEADELLERLKYLWKRLQEAPEIQERFLASHSSCGEKTIEQISKEVKKYEGILHNNLESIIITVRQAIELISDKLTYTEEQKAGLRKVLEDIYTEQALAELEELLSSLELTFSKYQALFELASQRQALWERMCHLEELATDKSRLNNRGGRLLQEERERKTITDKLPKIEKRIKDMLARFEEEEGKTFLWHGKDLAAKIENDWALLTAEKENRKLKKTEQSKGITPQKRKMAGKEPNFGSKKNKVIKPSVLNTTVTLSKGGGADLGFSPALLMRSPTKKVSDISCSSISSYSEFQSKIDKAVEGQERPALRDVNVCHSSPTEGTACRSHPASASKSTPIPKHSCTPNMKGTPRLTPCTGTPSSTKRKIPSSPHPKYFIPYSKADRFKF